MTYIWLLSYGEADGERQVRAFTAKEDAQAAFRSHCAAIGVEPPGETRHDLPSSGRIETDEGDLGWDIWRVEVET